VPSRRAALDELKFRRYYSGERPPAFRRGGNLEKAKQITDLERATRPQFSWLASSREHREAVEKRDDFLETLMAQNARSLSALRRMAKEALEKSVVRGK